VVDDPGEQFGGTGAVVLIEQVAIGVPVGCAISTS